MNNAMYVFKQEKEKYDALVANETDNFALSKLGNEYREKAKRYSRVCGARIESFKSKL